MIQRVFFLLSRNLSKGNLFVFDIISKSEVKSKRRTVHASVILVTFFFFFNVLYDFLQLFDK